LVADLVAKQKIAKGFEQVGHARGIVPRQAVVGGKGDTHFLQLAGRPEHRPAVEHGGDLFEGERFVLDLQRRLHGADAVATSEPGRR